MNRKDVEVVCMDMWTSYRGASKIVFPDAVIVIDRFHIARMVQNSMEAFRKAIRKPSMAFLLQIIQSRILVQDK